MWFFLTKTTKRWKNWNYPPRSWQRCPRDLPSPQSGGGGITSIECHENKEWMNASIDWMPRKQWMNEWTHLELCATLSSGGYNTHRMYKRRNAVGAKPSMCHKKKVGWRKTIVLVQTQGTQSKTDTRSRSEQSRAERCKAVFPWINWPQPAKLQKKNVKNQYNDHLWCWFTK